MATATISNDVSNEEYVARARALAPVLRKRSEATNAARRPCEETIADLKAAGLFSLLQPKRYGGTERGLEPYLDCITALAAGCGSMGWIFSVISIHVMHIGYFEKEAQDDVWGEDPATLVGSSYMPGGRATPAPGGMRLSGRWNFSSGCDVSEWFILGGLAPGADGAPPKSWYFLVPRKDVTIIDNWRVIGLSGTGSKDVAVEDAFVPAHRLLDMDGAKEGVSPGREVNPGPLYSLPLFTVFPLCISAPAVGVAKGAVAGYMEEMRAKTTKGFAKSVADFHATQMRLAEAATLVDAAELLLKRDTAHTMRVVESGRRPTIEERVLNRRDHAWAAEASVRTVDLLYKMTGGAGLHDGHYLQRAFRDVHAIGAHIANNWDICGPLYGSVMLGRPPNAPTY